MPNLSIYDDNQTYVINNLIIGPRTNVEAVVHYFSARSAIHFSATSWSGLCRSNFTLEELLKYNMTFVSQLIHSLSINDENQTFGFCYSIIVPRTVVGPAIDLRYFSPGSTIHSPTHYFVFH